MITNPYNQFQAGIEGINRPPFYPAWEAMGMRKKGTTRPVTNVRIHRNFNILPLIKLKKGTNYLHKQVIFNFSHEGSFADADKLVHQYMRQGAPKRKKIDRGIVHNEHLHGYQAGTAIVALNLPFVNFLLANLCNDCDELKITRQNKISEEYKQYIIPPIEEMTDLFTPIGGNVTNIELDILNHGSVGPTVKAICMMGAVDVFCIWGACNYEQGTSYIFNRIRPQTRVGYVMRVVDLEKENISSNLIYILDNEVQESVDYKKKIVWKVEPYIFESTEQLIKDARRFTYERDFEIEDGKGLDALDENDRAQFRNKTVVYKPCFYKLGYLSGPATGGDGTPQSFKNIRYDPAVNCEQLQRLPIIELAVDVQIGWFKPV